LGNKNGQQTNGYSISPFSSYMILFIIPANFITLTLNLGSSNPSHSAANSTFSPRSK